MKPCVCGTITNRPEPIGIQRDAEEKMALVLWNCRCGTTRATKVADCSHDLISRAVMADMKRMREGAAV